MAPGLRTRVSLSNMRSEERYNVKNCLHQRAGNALVLLTLGTLSVAVAGCDDSHPALLVNTPSSLVTTPSSFNAVATLSPSFVGLTRLGGFDCSGFVFGTSFNLVVAASAQDLTLDSVTLHMIDGTNLGGPSVTIPTPQLASQFGSTVVRAGTTRAFGLRPVFPCVGSQPHSLTATAVLLDQHRVRRTLTVTARVR